MAAEAGRSAVALDGERRLAQDAPRYDLFQLLRRLEQLHHQAPRFGEAKRADDEPVRVGQSPYLTMPTGTVAAFAPGRDGRQASLDVRWPGLMGPMGPLPLHLTAFARRRIDHARDPTFARFCDALQHRFILLFYRAWAASQPAVASDREDDRFASRLEALAGIRAPEWSAEERADRDLARHAAWYLVGRGTRHPAGLTAVLTATFGIEARIREFIGVWLDLPARLQTRLDGRTPLGEAPLLGARFRSVQQRFRIVLGPMPWPVYEQLLPTAPMAVRLWRFVRTAVGPALEFELQLILAGKDVPSPRLDGSVRLGFTSWLRAPATPLTDAADLVLIGSRLEAGAPADAGA